MSITSNSTQILNAADSSLRAAAQSLVSAEPDELEHAQRLLEKLASTLSGIESQARREPATISKGALRRLRTTLTQAGTLNRMALNSINRQLSRAGLESADSGFTVEVQG